MLNPKSSEAKYKCKPGCRQGNLCATCRNYRKTFAPGKVVTWGCCTSAFPIVRVESDGVIVNVNTGTSEHVDELKVLFHYERELQLTSAKVGKIYPTLGAAIPV